MVLVYALKGGECEKSLFFLFGCRSRENKTKETRLAGILLTIFFFFFFFGEKHLTSRSTSLHYDIQIWQKKRSLQISLVSPFLDPSSLSLCILSRRRQFLKSIFLPLFLPPLPLASIPPPCFLCSFSSSFLVFSSLRLYAASQPAAITLTALTPLFPPSEKRERERVGRGSREDESVLPFPSSSFPFPPLHYAMSSLPPFHTSLQFPSLPLFCYCVKLSAERRTDVQTDLPTDFSGTLFICS